MSQKPLFTIVIPTLGKVEQWEWAIYSVISQKYKNWEVIAIDSGPEINSRPLIEKFNDERIKYVNTFDKNPRLNWDVGFRKSSGQYILWLDDDNYLLPNALEVLTSIIEKNNFPDVVTGEHVHYRGPKHYIKEYRNQLVIPLPLFDGKIKRVDQEDVILRLMGWPQKNPDIKARFHTSENAVKKSVIQALVDRIGAIDFGTTSTHALRLGMLALASDVYAVNTPIAIIGQSGTAMTDTWPHIDSPILKEFDFAIELSPVSAKTYANYRTENLLQTKKYLEDKLSKFEVNFNEFLGNYARELIVLDQSWNDIIKHWKELWFITRNSPGKELEGLHKKIWKYVLASFIVKTLKTIKIYRLSQKLITKKRISRKNQLSLKLDKFGVKDIRSCAENLQKIVESELKIPYKNFIIMDS